MLQLLELARYYIGLEIKLSKMLFTSLETSLYCIKVSYIQTSLECSRIWWRLGEGITPLEVREEPPLSRTHTKCPEPLCDKHLRCSAGPTVS